MKKLIFIHLILVEYLIDDFNRMNKRLNYFIKEFNYINSWYITNYSKSDKEYLLLKDKYINKNININLNDKLTYKKNDFIKQIH